jgi:transposase-like protein
MSGKGYVCADEEPKDKRKSKVKFLLENVEMSVAPDRGISIAAVCCHYGVNESTLYLIKKDEDKIKGSVTASAPLSMNISCIVAMPSLKR